MADPHLDQVREVTPAGEGCASCIATGDRWVHLRMCMTCGHVGCCDSSKNRHATAHFHRTQHPIVQDYEPGEEWWCYLDAGGFFDDRGGRRSPSLSKIVGRGTRAARLAVPSTVR